MNQFNSNLNTSHRKYEPLDVTKFGKPFAVTYNYAEKMLTALNNDRSPHRIYMIGDNPKSDIRGANTAGEHWTSVS